MRNANFRTDNTGQVHCRCHHAATMFPLHTRWLQNLLFLPNWVTSHKVEAIKYSTYLLLIFWLIFFHFKCICVCRFVEGSTPLDSSRRWGHTRICSVACLRRMWRLWKLKTSQHFFKSAFRHQGHVQERKKTGLSASGEIGSSMLKVLNPQFNKHFLLLLLNGL